MKRRAEMAHLGNKYIELLVMQRNYKFRRIVVAVNLLSTGKLGADASLLRYCEI